jgi:peptidyl-prolyl cis-trans isomerase B (cyclophilin B)
LLLQDVPVHCTLAEIGFEQGAEGRGEADVASTKDRQRALERARYERVQAKIAKQAAAARRRRRVAIFTSVAVVVVGGGSLAAALAFSSSPKTTPAASNTPTAAASSSASPSSSPEKVGYTKSGTASKNVGVPTYNAASAAKPYTATIHTNRGDVVFTALTTKAPYTTFSFQYLAGKNYFNSTPCHRLTTSGIYVLQCGDPSGSGSGGPGYAFQDENLGYFGTGSTVTYKAGTVAMANSGPGTNGSQFFLVYKDSPLPPNYTPFGTITKGLDVLTGIAAKGDDGSNGTGDGKPKEAVTITSVTIAQS